MIRHHPDDALLLAHAAGNLPSGAALVLESHLEACAECCKRVHLLHVVGGVLLDDIEPATLAPDALTRALAAIDGFAAPAASGAASDSAPGATVSVSPSGPVLPLGVQLPRALDGCEISPWRWLGPGMRWSRVTVPYDRAANVFLLRIGAGKNLPMHSHSDLELTQVLHGEFGDERSQYRPGDFDGADGDIHHQPVVRPGGECICLTSVEGRVLFKGLIARTVGALAGM